MIEIKMIGQPFHKGFGLVSDIHYMTLERNGMEHSVAVFALLSDKLVESAE